MFDLHHLKVFIKVFEYRSFSGAADALFLSQPTISEHIKTLESHFRIKLFNRTGRIAIPTQAGDILHQHALIIMANMKDTQNAMESFSDTSKGRLLIGASNIPGQYLLPEVIGSFKSNFPEIKITLKISDSRAIVDSVISGELEIGFVGAKFNHKDLHYKNVAHDKLVVIVYPDHPWAVKGKIDDPSKLIKEPFIIREYGSGTRRSVVDILNNMQLDIKKMNIIAEMGSNEAICQGVKAGIGISILSEIAVADDIEWGKLVSVIIPGAAFEREFFLVTHTRRTLSSISKKFLASVKKFN